MVVGFEGIGFKGRFVAIICLPDEGTDERNVKTFFFIRDLFFILSVYNHSF